MKRFYKKSLYKIFVSLFVLFYTFVPPYMSISQVFAANPSADLDQWANTDNAWVNGNLGASKAKYYEGDSVPYRMKFENLSLDSHTVTFEWDTTKGGKHALDYLTTYNRSVSTDPCIGISGCSSFGIDTESIPNDPQVTGAGVTPIPGVFTLLGGTITDVSAYSYPLGTGFDGDKTARITITFTANEPNPVLAWSGHIANRSDWGPDNAAVSIPGSPYHTSLVDLDGKGGSQDLSLSTEAVIFPASITIIKQATPEGPAEFSFTGTPSPLTNFTLVDDGTITNTKVFSNITDFKTYTVTENTLPSNWNLININCSVVSPNGGSQNITRPSVSINLKEGENVTCTFSNERELAPVIEVTKTANPTSVPETGGNVTFTFSVENMSNEQLTLTSLVDNIFGNLDGQGTCDVPQTLAVGGSYSCSIIKFLSSDSLTAHTNVTTAVALDGEGDSATDFDDATVTFTDVAPQIRITKTGNPTAVPETGGNVTFTFLVENIGNEDVILNSLSDTVFGNLDGKGTCDVPQTILIGGSYSCSYTVFLASDSLTAHYNVVTATAVDDDGTQATDEDDETITFTDIKPTVTIDKSVTPSILAEPGGDFTFTLKIKNTSTENVNITSLVDSNALSQECLDLVGDTLVPGQEVTCSYTISHTTIGVFENTATVVVTDNDGSTATDFDTESGTVAGAYISFTQLLATNPINEPHTFTVTVMKNSGTGGYIAAAGELVTFSLVDNSAGATFEGGVNTCTTNLSGQCSIQINSTSPGTVDIHAYVVVEGIEGLSIERETNGNYGSSIDAVKTYVAGNIIIKKETIPDVNSQVFEFNPNWSTTNFNLSNGGSTNSGSLAPGTYYVEEILPSGWDLTSIVCDDTDSGVSASAGNTASVVLAANETVTCTFTNTKLPTLEIKKILVPSTANGTFDLKIDGTVYASAVGHNGTTGPQIVSIGSHTFRESAAGGTNMNVYKVVYGGDTGCGTDGSITLAAGENKVCTITNYAKGTIQITKDVVPNDSSLWDFSLSGPTDGPTSKNDLGDGESYIFSYLNQGTYTLSEATDDNYVTSINCGVNGTSSNGTISLDISWGENAYCTVTNARKGEITACKYEDLNGDGVKDDNETPLSGISMVLSEYIEGDWVERGTQETSENGCTTFDKLLPGEYKVEEDYEDPDLDGYYSSNSVFSHEVNVVYGTDITVDFLNTKYRSISGVKFLDINYNGVKDVAEPGLEGWTIFIDTNFSRTYQVGEQFTVTGEDGEYSFEGLVADTYWIGEVLKDGWMQTYPSLGVHDVELHYEYTGTDIDFGNNIIPPMLEITKLNDRGLSGIYVEDEVMYTIKVRAPYDEISGTYFIKDVKVIDILPEGFEYVSGSWTGTSTEPVYNGVPAQWYIGDMQEGDEVTLTYKAKVSPLQGPGTYKDIVYTYGTSILGGNILGLGVYSGDSSTSLVRSSFVGTQVLVIQDPVLEEGEVLGTSIELPRTGAQTYLTLGAIISMILGFILLVFNPKRKTKTLFLTGILLLGVFTLVKPTETFALVPEVEVQIEQPASPTKEDTFKIGFVALDIKDRDIKVQCYVNSVSFGPEYSTNSGNCEVTPSVITSSGTYNFYVVATPVGGTAVQSETVQVEIKLEKPLPVTNYVKTEGVCTYTLTFKTANDGRTSKVEIFRSSVQPFTANASTWLNTSTVGPNTSVTYIDNDPLDCSKEYYYAIRALDDLNNFSTFVTDNIINIVEGTTSTTVTVNGETGEVAGEETTAGEDTENGGGEEKNDNGEVKGDEDQEDEDTGDQENGDEDITSFWNKYKYVIIAVAVVALGSAGYSYVRRKK